MQHTQLKAKIGDLGLSCKIDSDERKELPRNLDRLSPEKAEAILSNNSEKIKNATTTQNDIWELGLVFFALFSDTSRMPEMPEMPYPTALKPKNNQTKESSIASVTQEAVQTSIDTELKKDTPEKIKKLIISMLSIDPKNRPSAEEISKILESLQPPQTT